MIATAAGVEGVAQTGGGRHIVVVGAGAFGGWTALELRRRGARVTLVDAWGPGNARASSGGETRVIRATYGARADLHEDGDPRAGVVARARRAMAAAASSARPARSGCWARRHRRDDAFGRASAAALRARAVADRGADAAGGRDALPADCASTPPSSPSSGSRRPGISSRAAPASTSLERFVAEGGEYRQSAVPAPVPIGDAPLRRVTLADGTAIEADAFVFACGPWLGRLFPDVIGKRVTPTRQEVYYFGTPPGDTRFVDPSMPVWVDFGER